MNETPDDLPGTIRVADKRGKNVWSTRPSTGSFNSNEHDRRLASLVGKLQGWLIEQPEFMHVLANGGRGERKRMATAIARQLFIYPRKGDNAD